MNDLKIFNNPEFGDIRTITINNEPYFVGKDVAEILGYSKARNAIATHVDMEDKKDAPIQGPLGGTQVRNADWYACKAASSKWCGYWSETTLPVDAG